MFKTIADVRQANKESGGYFFSRDTVRFFGSRVESSLYAGRYFITSEKAGFSSTLRKFTIREALPDGSVNTVTDTFNKFRCIEDAREECRSLAASSRQS